MDIQLIIIAVLFVACVAITFVMARRTGAGKAPLDLALSLVMDAEELVKPREGETREVANSRKLQYVLNKLQEAYPDVNVVALRNIIEGAVDILKRRLVTSNVSRPTITKLS